MYDVNTKRIDNSIGPYIHGSNKCQKYWKLIMFVFVLLFCLNKVERGFSINKEVEEQNIKKDSLVMF